MRGSLSARLLFLTVIFVLLSEVLIYVPSISRFRLDYLTRKLGEAHIAALALEATPAREVSPELESTLLRHIQAQAVEVNTGRDWTYMLGRRMPPLIEQRFDLRHAMFWDPIGDALGAMLQRRDRIIQVAGVSPHDPGVVVEVVLDEAPLRREMLTYSRGIGGLSIVISVIAGALVYVTLRGWIVRPLMRLTSSMIRFRQNPTDQTSLLRPSRRIDEVGTAERELAAMQAQLVAALGQRAHLVAVGEAVTRINHDLRNILSSAQLVADRLDASADPAVQRSAPRLVAAIDRAVALCSRVLEFARAGAPTLKPERIAVAGLLEEVTSSVITERGIAWTVTVSPGLSVIADRQHLFRVLTNLATNAVDAGATRIKVTAQRRDGRTAIDLADDGPGLPEANRERLFQPFSFSTKDGGSGLGLAIARELMLAHGGDLLLVETGPAGTAFRLDLPAAERSV